jgi:hypothetical protein
MSMCMSDMEKVQAVSLHDKCLVFIPKCMDLMHHKVAWYKDWY